MYTSYPQKNIVASNIQLFCRTSMIIPPILRAQIQKKLKLIQTGYIINSRNIS